MRKVKLPFCFLLVFAVSGPLFGQLEVRILDATTSVYSWEPVFVAFEIRNEGHEPVLIPVDGCGEGTGLEVGLRGGALEARCIIRPSEPRAFAWLLPGERRLFVDSIALGAEGLFEIEAVVRSPGQCVGALFGSTRLPLPGYREIEGRGPTFECWSGEVRSRAVIVNVEIPTSDVDLAAAKFIGNNDGPLQTSKGLMFVLKDLVARFPTSHYTYAAMFGPDGKNASIRGVALQPDNPLNRWAVAAYAASLAGRTHKCAQPDPTGLFKPAEAKKRLERVLADFPLPEVAKAFLDQQALDFAAEQCPNRELAGDSSVSNAVSTNTSSGAAAHHETTPEESANGERFRNQRPTLVPQGATAQPSIAYKWELYFPNNPAAAQVQWISIPYRYAPPDVGTPGMVDAQDLCQDLGTPSVTAIIRWNEPTSTFVEHTCGDPAPFPLVQGMGYGIRIKKNNTFLGKLTGAHDDAFAFSIPPTGGSQMSWISLPPHLRKTASTQGRMSAQDLCQQIGLTEARAIVRWDDPTSTYQTYVCGSSFQTPFEIKRGIAYGVINKPGQTITWLPEHY